MILSLLVYPRASLMALIQASVPEFTKRIINIRHHFYSQSSYLFQAQLASEVPNFASITASTTGSYMA
jgi:hypothetical protein